MSRLILGLFSFIYFLSPWAKAHTDKTVATHPRSTCSQAVSRVRFDHLPKTLPLLRMLLDAEILLGDPRVKILPPRSHVLVPGSYVHLRNLLEEALIQIGYPEPELALNEADPDTQFFVIKGNYRYRFERTIRNSEIFYWLVDTRFLEPTDQTVDRFHPPTREMVTGHRLDIEDYLIRWLDFLRMELNTRSPIIEISSEASIASSSYTRQSLSILLFQALDRIPDPSLSSRGLPLLLFDYSDSQEKLFYVRIGEPRNRQWLTFERSYGGTTNPNRISYRLISVNRKTPLPFRTGLGPHLISLMVEQRKSFWDQLFLSLSTPATESKVSPISFNPDLPIQRPLADSAHLVVEHIESAGSNSLDLNLLYESLRTGGSGISGCHTLDCWETLVRLLCLKNGTPESNGLFFFLGPQPPLKKQIFSSPFNPNETVTLRFWDTPYFIRNYNQSGYSRTGVKTVFSLDGLDTSRFIRWVTEVGIDFASRDPRAYHQGLSSRVVTVTPGLTIFFAYEQRKERELVLKTWYPINVSAEP